VSAFVGRAEELNAVAEIAALADDGPSAAVIIGDPGSCKMRLLAEASDQVRLPTELRVVGYEPEYQVPLAAAADLLRLLADVPELGARLNALVFESEDASALKPVRIFELAHRALARKQPALLIVDDLQWVVMSKKPIRTIGLVFMSAAVAVAFSATPAAATPTSPGACNMLNVSPVGMDGMLKASDQGLGNMMKLVVASEVSGCTH